jgi:hypothetical protein
MNSEIDLVISLLDKDKDCLLIALLRQKKESKVFIQNKEFDAADCVIAKKRIDKLLIFTKEQILDNHKYYRKIENILEKNSCYGCRFSVKKWNEKNCFQYNVPDNSRLGCSACAIKKDKFSEYLEGIDAAIDLQFKTLITKELIETYTLLFILEKKLKQTKNTHETSQH